MNPTGPSHYGYHHYGGRYYHPRFGIFRRVWWFGIGAFFASWFYHHRDMTQGRVCGPRNPNFQGPTSDGQAQQGGPGWGPGQPAYPFDWQNHHAGFGWCRNARPRSDSTSNSNSTVPVDHEAASPETSKAAATATATAVSTPAPETAEEKRWGWRARRREERRSEREAAERHMRELAAAPATPAPTPAAAPSPSPAAPSDASPPAASSLPDVKGYIPDTSEITAAAEAEIARLRAHVDRLLTAENKKLAEDRAREFARDKLDRLSVALERLRESLDDTKGGKGGEGGRMV